MACFCNRHGCSECGPYKERDCTGCWECRPAKAAPPAIGLPDDIQKELGELQKMSDELERVNGVIKELEARLSKLVCKPGAVQEIKIGPKQELLGMLKFQNGRIQFCNEYGYPEGPQGNGESAMWRILSDCPAEIRLMMCPHLATLVRGLKNALGGAKS